MIFIKTIRNRFFFLEIFQNFSTQKNYDKIMKYLKDILRQTIQTNFLFKFFFKIYIKFFLTKTYYTIQKYIFF